MPNFSERGSFENDKNSYRKKLKLNNYFKILLNHVIFQLITSVFFVY